MITQQTAGRVWNCYREIAAAEQLLKDMAETAEKYRGDVRAESLRNAFGEQRGLQLGVPSGEASHRLLDVSPSLAKIVIETHINEKRTELLALKELCRSEIDAAGPARVRPSHRRGVKIVGRATTDAEIEAIWWEFWLPLVSAEDGTVDMMRVKRELANYRMILEEVPKVYMHVSGNQFSKPNTAAMYVTEAADEHYRKLYETDSAELK